MRIAGILIKSILHEKCSVCNQISFGTNGKTKPVVQTEEGLA